jgi:PAS domain S-box-containing protein
MIKNSTDLDPHAWLAAIIDSSDDAIVSKTLEGIVTTWNKGAQRIFGFTSEEMVGQPILKIIPENRQQEEVEILRRLRHGERVDHFETVRRRKDGLLIDVSVTISPVRDKQGQIIGVSKIARDITLAKQLQAELTVAKEAAESANRAKDDFIGVLSHELRTPLTPALAAASLMEMDETLPPPLREQISMIRRNIETEARLVDDLLDLTRISRGKMLLHLEVVNAHAVIRNVLTMFQAEIDAKSLAVSTILSARDHKVWADVGRFQQVLLNLMSNAVKFTPAKGAITIRTANEGSSLAIEVADDGIGIEPEVIPRLFGAFEQAERSFARRFGGLGLGLSIVKSLTESHNGSVSVHSAGKGQGSTFTISMPLAPAEQERAAPRGLTPNNQLPGNCHTLLVEDHDDTRTVMSLLLRGLGCNVTTAASVQEARQRASERHFDLLICDFGLPDGTGADVIRAIRLRQEIKAVAVTGFGQEEDLRRSTEAGFAAHLTKPVSVTSLQRAIQELSG